MKNPKVFVLVGATVFALIALLHFFRLILEFPMRFGGVDVPLSASLAALLFFFFLSAWGYSLVVKRVV